MPDADSITLDLAPRSPVVRWLLRKIPAIDSLRTYSLTAFGRDLTAGLTVATVAVPQAMAYATLAGLPPQYGLYTAIVMTAVGALLDSSRQLINGPTNAISIALLSALVPIPEGERVSAAILMACLVGLIQIGISLARLGDLTRFVSHSVIIGFTLGASVLLVLDQTKYLLGLIPRGDAHDHFLVRFGKTVVGSPVHWPTVAVGVGTIVIVVAVRQLNKVLAARRWRFPFPQHLVAVAFMAGLVWGFQLDQHQVQIVGAVPSSLPSFQLPEWRWEQTRLLSSSAFAIALLGLLEAVAMAKAIAARSGQKLDINQQCLSEGAANLAGSFFQCFPGSGSLTRSAVNQQAGAVSQWSGVFAAAAVAATVLLFGPLAQYIPRAALAGLLILAAYRMVDIRQLRFHLRATRLDAGVVVATVLAAVFISIEFCIVIGVFLSFALYVLRVARVKLTPIPPATEWVSRFPPGSHVLAYELDGELFFGAEVELARHFAAVNRATTAEVRAVILDLKQGRNPDASFLALLHQFHEKLQSQKVALILCGIQPDMAAGLANTGLDQAIGILTAEGSSLRLNADPHESLSSRR
jgi:SulP family sulfate permease